MDMKVGNHITLYAGTQPSGDMAGERANSEQKNRKTLYAGAQGQENPLRQRIAERKAQAQEKAMKIVGEALAGRDAIDEDLEKRRQHIKELKADNRSLHAELKEIASQREKLQDATDINAEEMEERLAGLDEQEKALRKTLGDNMQEVHVENAVIRQTRREMLKDQSMIKAEKQADNIMAAANDEIIGMVLEDAKDHVDEEAREREEQADKIKEEREEQEALQEKREERKEELEKLVEEIPMEEMLSMDRLKEDVKQEIQNIVSKMKLVAEDIKGAAVDESL